MELNFFLTTQKHYRSGSPFFRKINSFTIKNYLTSLQQHIFRIYKNGRGESSVSRNWSFIKHAKKYYHNVFIRESNAVIDVVQLFMHCM